MQTFCGTANQQVIAILLKALLHLGYFPRSLRQVPAQVWGFIVEQLGPCAGREPPLCLAESHTGTSRGEDPLVHQVADRHEAGQAGVGSVAAARRRRLRADLREAIRIRLPTSPPSPD